MAPLYGPRWATIGLDVSVLTPGCDLWSPDVDIRERLSLRPAGAAGGGPTSPQDRGGGATKDWLSSVPDEDVLPVPLLHVEVVAPDFPRPGVGHSSAGEGEHPGRASGLPDSDSDRDHTHDRTPAVEEEWRASSRS